MATLRGPRRAARVLGAGTVLLTGALATVAVGLSAPPANAAVAEIDFTGGAVAGLFCRSTPSVNELRVPAGTRIRFHNHLGRDAVLNINGATFDVPSNNARRVWVATSTTASMTFPCTLSEDFRSVTITVTDGPFESEAPPPPRPTTPAAKPTTAAAPAPPPAATRPAGASTRTPAAAPPNGTAARAGTLQSAVPTRPATPRAAATSGAAPVTGANSAGAAPGEASPLAGQPAGDPSAAAAAPDEPVVGALEPAAGTPVSGPTGLLALLAAVSVVGVTYAALRTIFAKRAGRSRYA
ncbi:MAG TPA: hypothetical protein VK453_12600 [Micromonosporaceae bacterium]|nr:hypothetical protein [Micromonosporaceae bacterium]